MDNITKCKDCHYFVIPGGESGYSGNCHRYPPTKFEGDFGERNYQSAKYDFPEITADNWCGEFKHKEPAAKGKDGNYF